MEELETVKIGKKTYLKNPRTGEMVWVRKPQKATDAMRRWSSPEKVYKKVVMHH